jgi:tetratricopeptide (TPR) repeat protein
MIGRASVGAAVFLVALDGGSYSLASRHVLAIAVWWTLLVGFALGILPRSGAGQRAAGVALLLGLFVVWTGLSALWSPSVEKTLLEFDRAALFFGVFALTAVVVRRDEVASTAEGIGLGLVAVAFVALWSRLLPGLPLDADVARLLPETQVRLSWPVNYWNGLGILLALAVPLLLGAAAMDTRAAWKRGVAAAPLPAIAAAVYLTASRGGVATAALGVATFVALTAQRAAAVRAVLVSAAGAGCAVAVLASSDPRKPAAAAVIALCCLATGVVHSASSRFLVRARLPRMLGRAVAAACAVALVGGLATADLGARLDAAKQAPDLSAPQADVNSHLASGSASGRWQFWTAAADEFGAHPLLGGGAGSYEAWWAEHASFRYFVRDAHSLYLETLGELGVVGLGLILGSFAAALAAALGARRTMRNPATAAVIGAFAAFALGAGVDWIWELTAVSMIGAVLLGLLAGPLGMRGEDATSPNLGWLRAAALSASVLIICLEALPLVTHFAISSSQAAALHGNAAAALQAADVARRLEPFAASPNVQRALVLEQIGEIESARTAIGDALSKDRRDWRVWLIAARLETKDGAVERARTSLARAAALNPRSPLFEGVQR